jgi:hypothetical protein
VCEELDYSLVSCKLLCVAYKLVIMWLAIKCTRNKFGHFLLVWCVLLCSFIVYCSSSNSLTVCYLGEMLEDFLLSGPGEVVLTFYLSYTAFSISSHIVTPHRIPSGQALFYI